MKENHSTVRRYDREFKDNAVALVRAGRTNGGALPSTPATWKACCNFDASTLGHPRPR